MSEQIVIITKKILNDQNKYQINRYGRNRREGSKIPTSIATNTRHIQKNSNNNNGVSLSGTFFLIHLFTFIHL